MRLHFVPGTSLMRMRGIMRERWGDIFEIGRQCLWKSAVLVGLNSSLTENLAI